MSNSNSDTATLPPSAGLTEWVNAHARNWPEAAVKGLQAAETRWAEAGDQYADGRANAYAAAAVLADMGLDPDAALAAIAHGLLMAGLVDREGVTATWGAAVHDLVDGLVRMDVIQEFRDRSTDTGSQQSEALRKMLLAMVDDVRVVLIKLAVRLDNMRRLKNEPEVVRQQVAQETMEIFAPLANRLGIWQMKWELEDLAFRFLHSDTYQRIARQIAERRVDREEFLKQVVARIDAELRQAGVSGEVTSRPKHIYSIWRKMQRKQVEYDEIFDVRAVRILVDSIPDCYTALGIVHGLWPHIAREFDDYIANPKQNNYQSLHTAVVGPEGKHLEVQIRTHEMHRNSELGVAAHWRYKEGSRLDAGLERKINWLRQLLAWKDEVADSENFLDHFKSETLEDVVYVFTPQGKIIDLPLGSTPLDFAYAVHTSVGHRCRGAKVNGKMVQLTHALSTGDQVEILTAKEGSPSRDWLNPHLGYLHTSRARSRVRSWFKQQDLDKVIADGRTRLEGEVKRLGLRDVNFEKVAEKLGFNRLNDFLAALGREELGGNQLIEALGGSIPHPPEGEEKEVYFNRRQAAEHSSGVMVEGVGDLLTQMAGCCHPVPPEPIVGYITRGRGVTIHREDCRVVLDMDEENQKRLIEVGWSGTAQEFYAVEVLVTAYDRPGLLRDITGVLANEKVNVTRASTQSDRKDHTAEMRLTVEICELAQLHRVLAKIGQLRNVIDARRA